MCHHWPRWLLLGLVPLAAACSTVAGYFGFEEEAPPRVFPHVRHGAQEELSCTDCHGRAVSAPEAGMPKMRQCVLCHEGIDEEKPPERTLAALVGEKPEWSQFAKAGGDVIFSHQVHTAKEVPCADCHQGVTDSAHVVAAEVRVSMDECIACHVKSEAPAECDTCHRELRRDRPPATHRLNWRRTHGAEVGAPLVGAHKGRPYESRCTLCHTESSCTGCHQSQPPQNHTTLWRLKGHSVVASVDRSSCRTCHHRTDFCDRCHQSTRPRTHTVAWGGRPSRHCLSCHLEPDRQGCALCHRQGSQSHVLAPPKPAWHVAGMNCRQCHGPGLQAPMFHPDNGSTCTTCHR